MRRLFLICLAILPGLAAAQPAPEYVGSDTCRDCHVEAAEAWEGSHHALAWTLPSPDSVIADFDGTGFSHDGMTARFRRAPDGQYHVGVIEKNGTSTEYPLHSVVGIAPLQQYLLETEPGRLQSFDVVWDAEAGRWFHLYPDQDLPPEDGLHWTGPYKNWNARCAECHATGFEKNYDPASRSYASTQAELGVGCEACHGPGSAHTDWAVQRETTRDAPAPENYGFSAAFGDTEAAIQQCATCHSRREAFLEGNPLPGTPYGDAYSLALLRPGLYHADGQILDEVYVYGSFLQSKMYAQGVGCLDCHDAHTARAVAEGNAVCTQCHAPAGNPDFPRLRGALYDSPDHHFHTSGTPGAQCKDCHMIERVYMGVDGRRDHSFRIPRPDLAAATGAPDACTDCHEDRGADWAAAEIAARFPDAQHRRMHYGQVLARGRDNPSAASRDLAVLAADAAQPGIVRATALWLLEQSGAPDVADRLEPLLADPDPLVRAGAVGLQRIAAPQDSVPRIVGMLDDPVRAVRMAAARAMLGAPIARLPDATAQDLLAATREWQAALANRVDFPETHLVLGGMALSMRNLEAANAAFGEAVRMDPQNTDAWIMLARIAAASGGADAARAVLDSAIAAAPADEALQALRRGLPDGQE